MFYKKVCIRRTSLIICLNKFNKKFKCIWSNWRGYLWTVRFHDSRSCFRMNTKEVKTKPINKKKESLMSFNWKLTWNRLQCSQHHQNWFVHQKTYSYQLLKLLMFPSVIFYFLNTNLILHPTPNLFFNYRNFWEENRKLI